MGLADALVDSSDRTLFGPLEQAIAQLSRAHRPEEDQLVVEYFKDSPYHK
jgi:hypothetical protein